MHFYFISHLLGAAGRNGGIRGVPNGTPTAVSADMTRSVAPAPQLGLMSAGLISDPRARRQGLLTCCQPGGAGEPWPGGYRAAHRELGPLAFSKVLGPPLLPDLGAPPVADVSPQLGAQAGGPALPLAAASTAGHSLLMLCFSFLSQFLVLGNFWLESRRF